MLVMRQLFLSGLMLVSIPACVKFQAKPDVLERHGIDVIAFRDDQKVAYLKEKGHLDQVCAARESDVFATESTGFSLSGSAAGESGKIGGGEGMGAEALGGRSPLVLIAREYLYRACELSMNSNADTDKRIKIYQMFLDAIGKLSQSAQGGTAPQTADAPGEESGSNP